jgi:hypothetical protein
MDDKKLSNIYEEQFEGMTTKPVSLANCKKLGLSSAPQSAPTCRTGTKSFFSSWCASSRIGASCHFRAFANYPL